MVALARIDPSEIQKQHQQHLPVNFEVGKQPVPVDLILRLENGMSDVGAVMAASVLDEALGPDKLRWTDDPHLTAQQLDLPCMLQPLVADRHGAVRRREYDVKKMRAFENLSKPSVVRDLDRIAGLLEMGEDAGKVAGLAENIEVFGLARDARIGAHRVGAGDKKGDVRRGEFADRLCIKDLGLGVLKRRRRLRIDRRNGCRDGASRWRIVGHEIVAPRPSNLQLSVF